MSATPHVNSSPIRSDPRVRDRDCIVTGGGLSHDQNQWVKAAHDFPFPVHHIESRPCGEFMAGPWSEGTADEKTRVEEFAIARDSGYSSRVEGLAWVV